MYLRIDFKQVLTKFIKISDEENIVKQEQTAKVEVKLETTYNLPISSKVQKGLYELCHYFLLNQLSICETFI